MNRVRLVKMPYADVPVKRQIHTCRKSPAGVVADCAQLVSSAFGRGARPRSRDGTGSSDPPVAKRHRWSGYRLADAATRVSAMKKTCRTSATSGCGRAPTATAAPSVTTPTDDGQASGESLKFRLSTICHSAQGRRQFKWACSSAVNVEAAKGLTGRARRCSDRERAFDLYSTARGPQTWCFD